MKEILLGDLHFGVSNDDEKILEIQLQFFEEQLFPYMKENNISNIIQLGDLMDNRTKIGVNTLYQLRTRFFDYMKENNIEFITLLGNHDIYTKTNLEINSTKMWEFMYDNVKVIDTLTMLNIDNKNLLISPWLLPNESMNISNYPEADYIFGHFEVQGVEMVKGYECNSKHAFKMDDFKNIPTFSGHFHLKRYFPKKNLYYVGQPYQGNFGDFNEDRGFHVLDIPTGEIEYYENTVSTRHIKIYINHEEKNLQVLGLGLDNIIDVNSKTDYSIFKNHKAKIYIEKDIQFNKKCIEQLNEYLLTSRVEVLNVNIEKVTEEQEVDLDNQFDVVDYINKNLNTDYKKDVFNEIHKEALINLGV